MAKKVKGAIISFQVTDDGTLKAIGTQAGATGKALGGVGKSSRDVNRNMQAMSGRVESGTKGFARMQQGTGGLVQAYAILASTLFAVGAAFRALEQAQNIQAQIRGFKELTAITGTSMLSITNSVRAATGGLLDFQTAAQQTAIATAAGFSQNQIVALAEGARNASVALGRDLTDSFNRLIRGVTKAEPELLDELGVILRLDIATRKFAAANGLSAEKLSIAQRRTAVFNEVAEQLANNFGAINSEAMSLLNPFTKFATQLSDIAIGVGGFFTRTLIPLIEFLDRNSYILAGLLALITKAIVGQMIPAVGNLSQAFTNMGVNSQNQLKKLTNDNKASQKAIDTLGKKFQIGEVRKSKFVLDGLKKRNISEKKFNAMTGKQQLKLTRVMIAEEKKRLASTKYTTSARLKAYQAAEKRIQLAVNKTSINIGTRITMGARVAEKGLIRLGLVGQSALTAIGTRAAALAPIISALGVAFIAALGIFFALMTVTFFVEMIPAVKKAKEAVKGLREEAKRSEEAFVLSGIAMASFAGTHIQAIIDNMEDVEAATKSATKAVDFLAKAMANVGQGPDAIMAIENAIQTAMGDFGSPDLSGGILAGTLFQSNQAIAAGRIYMNNFMTEAIAAANTNEDLVQKALAQAFTPTNVEIDEYNPMGERGGSSAVVTRRTDSRAVQTGIDRAAEVMELVNLARSATEGTQQYERAMQAVMDKIDDFGLDYRIFLQILNDGAGNYIALSELSKEYFLGLSDENAITKSRIQGVADLNQALKDLNDTMDLQLGKPTAIGKSFSGLQKVFNEIDDIGGPGQKTITIESLSEGQRADLEEITGQNQLTLDIYDIAIFKLQQQLDITKDQAEQLYMNRQVLLDTLEITDRTLQAQKAHDVVLKAELALMGQLKDSHTKRLITTQKMENLEDKILQKTAELRIAQTNIRKENETQRVIDQERVNLLAAQKFELEAQMEIMKNQLDTFFQFRKALVEAFDTSMQTGLQEAILGNLDGGELANKIAEDMQKAGAKAISERITSSLTGGVKSLFGMGDKVAELTPEAQAIKTAHQYHIDELKTVLEAHAEAFGNETMSKKVGDVNKLEEIGLDKDGNPMFGLKNKVEGELGSGIDKLDGTGGADAAIAELKDAIKEPFKGLTDFFGGIFGNIGAAFGGIGGGGGIGGFFSSLFGLERGGVIGLAKGGMARYAHGGIAKQPTYLVGEGKKNEAVVPLPDNKSIPVDLGNSGGNTNNTNITVNMADGSTTTDTDGSAALAQAIDAAVQNTIEKELRPGGVLAGG